MWTRPDAGPGAPGDITAGILAFLRTDLGVDTARIDPGTPLFSTGLLDSFSILAIMSHIEAVHGFEMAAEDVTYANLDSVARIVAYIHAKTARPAPPA